MNVLLSFDYFRDFGAQIKDMAGYFTTNEKVVVRLINIIG